MGDGRRVALCCLCLGECARNAHILNRAGCVDNRKKDGIENGALNKGIDEMNGKGINCARFCFLFDMLGRATTDHGEDRKICSQNDEYSFHGCKDNENLRKGNGRRGEK